MKKINLLLGSIAGLMLAGFLFAAGVSAHSFRTGDSVVITQGQSINETLFVSGKNIDINSTVNGDIFCIGQSVTISGTIEGDVICAAQTIRVSGTIDGDVRLAGQTVSLSADISGNASIVAQTFTLDSEGQIARDLSIGAQDVSINGDIGRDLAVGSTNVVVGGEVGGDIKGMVTNMRLASSANVQGSIDYTSANDLTRDDGSQVAGEVTRSDPPKDEDSSKDGAVLGFGAGLFLYLLFAMLLVSMVLVLLLPRMFMRISDRALPHPWKALLVGFLAAIAVPVIIVLLLMSVIGIPLALLIGLGWLLLLLLSGPVTAFYIGRLVMRNSNNVLLYMLIGSLILLVLYFIPILGLFALLFALWAGVGMILLELFDRTPKPHYEAKTLSTRPSTRNNTK